jgi:hypothetical protein
VEENELLLIQSLVRTGRSVVVTLPLQSEFHDKVFILGTRAWLLLSQGWGLCYKTFLNAHGNKLERLLLLAHSQHHQYL